MNVMLAYNKIIDPEQLTYPVIASVKEDGYRCAIVDGKPQTRSGKQLANVYVRETLEALGLPELDGELVLVNSKSFNSVQSAFGSYGGSPCFKYVIFDKFTNPNDPYEKRFEDTAQYLQSQDHLSFLTLARNFVVNSPAELWELFHMAIDNGDEGLIIRDPKGPYKNGRSTLKQGWMLKLKPHKDAEATIVEVLELMHNEDAGNSNKLENMVPGNTMGAFLCKMPCGKIFKVGTGQGLTHKLRDEFWQNRDKLIGKPLTYTYHKLTEAGIPREPRIKGVRHLGDML